MPDTLNIKALGSFTLGGQRVALQGLPTYEAQTNANGKKRLVDPNGDFWTGQMYVQYVKLAVPKAPYPLLLWHGGGLTGSCWETTPDGREGWQMYFLRQGYDVYLSDAVERGRASWSRYPELYASEPIFRPYAHAWESMRVGPYYDSNPARRQPYPGSQCPVECFDAAMQQAVPRWTCNNAAVQAAYDAYVQKVGPAYILSHSQGGTFAATAALHQREKVQALVFVEPAGLPDPDQVDITVLKAIPQLFLWGDNLDKYPYWNKSLPGVDSYYKAARKYYEALARINPRVKWVELPDLGIRGNCHMLMQDRNSDEVAGIIAAWLKGVR